MVLDETLKGARKPKDNLFAASGKKTLRATRGLANCKVTVREIVAIRMYTGFMKTKLVFGVPAEHNHVRRFHDENIREVERVLNLEIQKREDDAEVRLKEPLKKAQEEKKAKKDMEYAAWRAQQEREWEMFTRKREARREG
jgi:hypothetical protein